MPLPQSKNIASVQRYIGFSGKYLAEDIPASRIIICSVIKQYLCQIENFVESKFFSYGSHKIIPSNIVHIHR